MKRKFGDRANWRRITNRQFTCRFVQSKIFTGYITLYTIQDLKEPCGRRMEVRPSVSLTRIFLASVLSEGRTLCCNSDV